MYSFWLWHCTHCLRQKGGNSDGKQTRMKQQEKQPSKVVILTAGRDASTLLGSHDFLLPLMHYACGVKYESAS